jgi:hypothetical protein
VLRAWLSGVSGGQGHRLDLAVALVRGHAWLVLRRGRADRRGPCLAGLLTTLVLSCTSGTPSNPPTMATGTPDTEVLASSPRVFAPRVAVPTDVSAGGDLAATRLSGRADPYCRSGRNSVHFHWSIAAPRGELQVLQLSANLDFSHSFEASPGLGGEVDRWDYPYAGALYSGTGYARIVTRRGSFWRASALAAFSPPICRDGANESPSASP